MMDINNRIKILYDGGVIDGKVRDLALKTAAWLSQMGINVEDEKGNMFITHLAMSFQRIKDGNTVEALEDFIIDELQNNKNYPKAQDFIDFIEKEGKIKLPESEKGYILLHICSLMEKEC
ncbi:PRD domain-containing protein [Tepidanaerobacter acetatoxydans]|nr:PRD domain-containing protein [Tepidanaerobacter acetatoxydans]